MCQKIKQLKSYLKQMARKYLPAIKGWVPSAKSDWVFFGGLVLVVFFVSSFFTHAHTAIAFVNMERVRELAEPYQEIEREREKYTQMWRVKFRAEQDVLDEEDKKLAAAQKKKSMKKKAFQKALDNLQKKSLALQKKYQKEAAKIVMATESAIEQIDMLASQTLHEIAENAGYDLIVSDNVLYVSETVDITDELVDELNKMAVKINYPDPETLTPNDE